MINKNNEGNMYGVPFVIITQSYKTHGIVFAVHIQ
jgi:hypothetical protein